MSRSYAATSDLAIDLLGELDDLMVEHNHPALVGMWDGPFAYVVALHEHAADCYDRHQYAALAKSITPMAHAVKRVRTYEAALEGTIDYMTASPPVSEPMIPCKCVPCASLRRILAHGEKDVR